MDGTEVLLLLMLLLVVVPVWADEDTTGVAGISTGMA